MSGILILCVCQIWGIFFGVEIKYHETQQNLKYKMKQLVVVCFLFPPKKNMHPQTRHA